MNYDRRYIEDKLAAYREQNQQEIKKSLFVFTKTGLAYAASIMFFVLILVLVR